MFSLNINKKYFPLTSVLSFCPRECCSNKCVCVAHISCCLEVYIVFVYIKHSDQCLDALSLRYVYLHCLSYVEI